MAGRKATGSERTQIVDMLKQGIAISEITRAFAEVDPRSITGLNRSLQLRSEAAMRREVESEATREHLEQLMAETNGAAHTQPEPPVDLGPEPTVEPQKPDVVGDGGTTQVPPVAQPRVPFTRVNERRTQAGNHGFSSVRGEYFTIERIDGQNPGFLGKEYPPFGLDELTKRYGPGTYKIKQFRNDLKIEEYQQQISPDVAGVSKIVQPQNDIATVTRSVKEVFEMVNGLRKESEGKMEPRSDSVASEAIKSMTEMAKNPVMNTLVTMMQEREKSAAEEHKRQLEAQAARHQQEMERERLKLEKEAELRKKELETQVARDREYWTKMQEIERERQAREDKLESERQKLFAERYDRLIDQVNSANESIESQAAERKKQLDELARLQTKHMNEMEEITKKSMSGGNLKVEEQKLMWGAIGKIGDGLKDIGNKLIHKNNGELPEPQPQSVESKPAPKSDMDSIMAEPWFDDMIEMIHTHITAGAKGDKMGQVFIDKMNGDPRIRSVYLGYLSVTTWDQLKKKFDSRIKSEFRQAFDSEQAGVWYTQFLVYVGKAWDLYLQQSGLAE